MQDMGKTFFLSKQKTYGEIFFYIAEFYSEGGK